MPTARELTRDEWLTYRQVAPPTVIPPTPDELRLRAHVLAEVREAAAALKQRFAVSRVLLFGSLADAHTFTSTSDVDLAVEGLAVSDYWAAWRTVEECIPDRTVDFVELERASSPLKQAILRYGIDV
ncbi:MAG: nucleotidyltransferase family protein [Oscillochloridaceae bacterium umkhey_bin13]